jgi:transposase-like protein
MNKVPSGQKISTVTVRSLRSGFSPRLKGEDRAHILRLAETETALPPILVDRRTMQVIDGMHRLKATSLRGHDTIDVEFFDGTPAESFLRAVEANVTHGFPLSQADRRAATTRIIETHPALSDRAISEVVGLGAKTVASIRRSCDPVSGLNTRIGRDGRTRPLNPADGRRRVAEVMAEDPRASQRQIARRAGVAPSTVRGVRRRLDQQEEPEPQPAQTKASHDEGGAENQAQSARIEAPQEVLLTVPTVLARLRRDPSLRDHERGRWLLGLLQHNAIRTMDWPEIVDGIPTHCSTQVEQLARGYSQMWLDLAQELSWRTSVAEPSGKQEKLE